MFSYRYLLKIHVVLLMKQRAKLGNIFDMLSNKFGVNIDESDFFTNISTVMSNKNE